jgi:hypothetical protein
MKAIVTKRARIARVRKVQHVQAAAVAARAETHASMLEHSAERLSELRGSLAPDTGMSSGAALSHASELAMRLDEARHGLTDAIVSARHNATREAEVRLEARRQQESAAKLETRAAAALAEFLERSTAVTRRRKVRSLIGDDQ